MQGRSALVLGSAFVPTGREREEETTNDGAAQIAAAAVSSAKLVNNIKIAKAEACLSKTVGSRRRTIYIEALASFLAFAIKLGRKVRNDPLRIARIVLSLRIVLQKSAKL